MIFNDHYTLVGKQHAFLSPSSHAWLNYDEEKLRDVYFKNQAKKRGSELHDLAERCIRLGQKLPPTKQALNQFVNDAIGYRMSPEIVLFYSLNAFGTADAISFRDNQLRIHDLKTGTTRVTMEQLEIYAALFCLEYERHPKSMDIELRIYQASSIIVHEPSIPDIFRIMNWIQRADKIINDMVAEEVNPQWMS